MATYGTSINSGYMVTGWERAVGLPGRKRRAKELVQRKRRSGQRFELIMSAPIIVASVAMSVIAVVIAL